MRNRYIKFGKNVVVYLERLSGDTFKTYVSIEDFEKLRKLDVKWFAMKDYTVKKYDKYYAGAPYNGTTLLMHRVISDCPKDYIIDHVDGNTLNNRRNNLRYVTKSQNALNRRGPELRSKSGILGVHWDKRRNKWRARVKKDSKTYYEKHFVCIKLAEIEVKKARQRAFNLDNV